MAPNVSVIIPTYNRADLIVEAIHSVLAQTYQDLELIVVDDGSTDGTREAVAPYVQRSNGRVRYVYQENQGLSAARNTGCRLARGQYLAFLDSDDLWKPEKLAVQVPVLDADPTVGLVSSMAETIDARNTRVLGRKPKHPAGTTLREMVTQGTQPPSSFVVRREAIEGIGCFDPEIRRGFEDVDLCFRLARRWKFVCLNDVLIRYRMHESNLTWDPIGTYEGCVQTYRKLLAAPGGGIPRVAARRMLAKYRYLLGATLRRRGALRQARAELTEAFRLWPFVGWMLGDAEPLWRRALNLTTSYGIAASLWLRPAPLTAQATNGSLHTRATDGLRWMGLNGLGERLLSFGTTMVLARLLDPAHFGLYALAFVAIDSLGIFKNLGLDAALIQRRDQVDEAADTAFMVLPLIGLTLCGLLALAAPALAAWLGQPQAAAPMQVLGLSLVLMSVGNVPAALVQKAMRFDLRAIANLSGMVVYAIVAIGLALSGRGVWSLVIAYLARWAVSVPVQWWLCGWRPRWRFDGRLLKDMLQFSSYVVGAWVVGLLATTVDKLVIGRWLGMTALGYYTLCLGLANFVTAQVGAQVYHVAFPAFAYAQDAPERLRRGFLKLMKYLLLASAPVAVLLMVAPQELLRVIYGERWVVAAPLVQILALGGMLQCVRTGIEPVLMGCGRSRAVFALNALQLALLSIGSTAMARAGSMTGVAWAVVVAAAIPGAAALAIVMRHVGLRALEGARHLWPIGVSAALMALVLALARAGLSRMSAAVDFSWAVLGALALLSGTAYLLGLGAWDRATARDLWHLVRPRLPSTVSRA